MPLTPPSDQSSSFQSQVNELSAYVHQAVSTGVAIHETEAGIWQHILAIGRSALEFYLSLQGDGDIGETVELENGKRARRLPARQSREYQSVFGSFRLERWVYGSRVGQRIECVPLDSRLQLPESKFSYLLQDWDQALAVESPYAQVNQTLERILGFSQSSDSLERMNRQMSESVSAFEKARPAPPLATAGQLIVASADGKGVPIRHPADSPTIAGHRPNRGPKPNRKRMATVGAIYTIEPRVRSPQAVLDALFREPRLTTGAKPDTILPQAKRVKAQLNLEPSAQRTAASATDQIFDWLKAQVLQRQPTTHVPLVLLMDGHPLCGRPLTRPYPRILSKCSICCMSPHGSGAWSPCGSCRALMTPLQWSKLLSLPFCMDSFTMCSSLGAYSLSDRCFTASLQNSSNRFVSTLKTISTACTTHSI
jgi:hypothetical protein